MQLFSRLNFLKRLTTHPNIFKSFSRRPDKQISNKVRAAIDKILIKLNRKKIDKLKISQSFNV